MKGVMYEDIRSIGPKLEAKMSLETKSQVEGFTREKYFK